MKKTYKKEFESAENKASKKADSKVFVSKLLYKVGKNIRNNPPKISKFKEELKVIFSFIKNYYKGNYREVGRGTYVTLLASLVYFINPFDAIPDFLPFVGYVDDASVLIYVYSKLNKEIEQFKEWQKANSGTKADIDYEFSIN